MPEARVGQQPGAALGVVDDGYLEQHVVGCRGAGEQLPGQEADEGDFADRDALLAAVCAAAMRELTDRMAAGIAGVSGARAEPAAARARLGAIGAAYLDFAREEPGLFATAFSQPRQHPYTLGSAAAEPAGADATPLGLLCAALDELVDAGVLDPGRREGLEYPIWSTVHGLAVLTGQGPLREVPASTHARSVRAARLRVHRSRPLLKRRRRRAGRPGRPASGQPRGSVRGNPKRAMSPGPAKRVSACTRSPRSVSTIRPQARQIGVLGSAR